MSYKGRCINFELWFIDEEEQDLDRIYETLEVLIKQDIDYAVADGCNSIIGLLLYEGFLYKDDDKYYQLLQRIYNYGAERGIIQFILICGIVWDYQYQLDIRNLNYKIIPFDYSANAVWHSYKNYPIPEWNDTASKYLFLGGVPDRENRIVLLSKFYDQNLLNNAIWSFFKPTYNNINSCRNMLLNYSDKQYDEFIDFVQRSVDDCYNDVKDYSNATGSDWKKYKYLEKDFFKDPNYINAQVFKDTAISVIAEGHVYPPGTDFCFLTEKTWRAVINRHPFILADNDMRKQFAKCQGLDIFEDFFINEYNGSDKLNGVVSNVDYFLKIKYDNIDAIKKAIHYNYLTFFNIINKNESILTDLKNNFNLHNTEIDKWFRQKSFDHLFRVPEYTK
jgi:hypothetical protein